MADYRNLSLTGGVKSKKDSRKSGAGQLLKFARVVDNHYTDPSLNVNQIRCKDTKSGQIIYAFPALSYISTVPLAGEFVQIVKGPGSESSGNSTNLDYYQPPVNLWNHPQHGASSDTGAPPKLAPEFYEQVDINPLKPYPGDIILEGRTGQSIRFSEGFSNTPWTSPSASQPVVIIANGQVSTTEGSSYIIEDINLDPASIYLTSNHKVPLEVDYQWKRAGASSYAINKLPLAAKDFIGKQVLVNGGRLYFNAKEESILLSAKVNVGLLADEVHLDAITSINLEAPTIHLTGDSLNPSRKQSAVKGDNLVEELDNLYSYLLNVTDLLVILASATNNADGVRRAAELADWLKTSTAALNQNLLSKKVFLS
jgi:hypothetical protein